MTIPPPPPGRFDDLNNEPENDGPIPFPLWRRDLLTSATGKVKALEANIIKVLRDHPAWQGVIRFDEFSRKLVAYKRAPFDRPGLSYPRQWTDTDTKRTMGWLQETKRILIDAGRAATDHALDVVGEINGYHPVRDYLAGLSWDGQQRLPTWLHAYLGAADSEYSREVGRLWLISAIARIMRPGCQVDYMLILEGNQGLGKSTALRTLFGDDWFSSSRLPIGSDEACKKLQGRWCQEIAELEAFRGRAWTEVKQFITDPIDNYRDSYGRRSIDHPRTVVFAGTTNDREYLGDRTGNRRFWPIHCSAIDRKALQRDRDQIWAEAYARYQSGEQWHMSPELEALAREEQRTRETREPWFELVQTWLADPTVPSPGGGRHRLTPSEGITQAEVFAGALNMRASDMTRDAQMRLGWVLGKLELERRRLRNADGSREYRYFPR